MRIVAWNCRYALHEKWKYLLGLNPDVAVISECAEPQVLLRNGLPPFSQPPVWTGSDPNHGLAVFFFSGYAGRRYDGFDPELSGILPVKITAPRPFNLLAVWAPTGLRNADLGSVRRSLDVYRRFLTDEEAVLAGDFNNNVIWDKLGYASNFRETTDIIDSFGIVSAYHAKTGEEYGKERTPTHYHAPQGGRPYHIDYIFMPRTWMARDFSLDIGSREEWIDSGWSDHTPVVLTIANS